MNTRFVAGFVLAAAVGFGAEPKKQPAMSEDMRQAIAFERHKDRAAAAQARKERTHPSVTYNNANRSAEEQQQGQNVQGQKVKDNGAAPKKK